MLFRWEYSEDTPQSIKQFVKTKDISKALLARVKFQGGSIKVNNVEKNVLYVLKQGDILAIEFPDEGEHETLLLDPTPISIVYEDAHFLIVDKPTEVASIPSQYHPNFTMANRVKNYFCEQNYRDRVIHVVTRLDRDTTGLMLFAKHSYAHSKMDLALREKKVLKKYHALIFGKRNALKQHGCIDSPIMRDTSSLMKRTVGDSGVSALTEYWVEASYDNFSVVRIRLHTGRTHQIRVHFSSIDCPLLGDEMYGGSMLCGISRQALHCSHLQFVHPFTEEIMDFTIPLPEDMRKVIEGGREINK